MEFLVEADGKVYEISETISKVSYKEKLNDGCGKLEFSFADEDYLNNGSAVRFRYNNDDIFFGYVFKHGRGKQKEVNVTAYDQLRYCKTKDTIVVDGDTVTTLTNRMCTYLGLRTGTLTDSEYVLATNVHTDKTWLDIVYSGISDTFYYKGKKYALRDEFGSITLRDVEDLQLNLILGDESLAYDFSYQKSIDDEFYNQVKLVKENEASGNLDPFIVKDSDSISKYGLLQYYKKLDQNANDSQAKEKADKLLELYNREAESLTLNCLGDARVRAGTSFYGCISDINLNRRLIVKEVTHNFLPVHTMTLEVAI